MARRCLAGGLGLDRTGNRQLIFPIAIVAQVQAAIFAPPLEVPIRVVTERIEPEGTYRIERLVRFHRDGAGYRAEVRLIAASAETTDFRKSMLDAGYGGLAGRTIGFRLDATGKVIEVIDLAAHWSAFCNGLAAMADKHRDTAAPERRKMAGQIADRFRTQPEAQQRAILASLINVLVSGDAAEAPGVSRQLRLPAVSPFGGSATLDGTRRFDLDGDRIRSVTLAEGDAPGQNGAVARITLESLRDTDRRTGLISTARETLRTRRGEETRDRISTVNVTIEPQTRWPD